MNIIELKAAIESKKSEISSKEVEIRNFEYESTNEEYDEFLDEIYGDVELGQFSWCASSVLKEMDPVAYHCGKSDYDGTKDLDDVEEHTDLQSELAELQDELEDLESELEESQEEENE